MFSGNVGEFIFVYCLTCLGIHIHTVYIHRGIEGFNYFLPVGPHIFGGRSSKDRKPLGELSSRDQWMAHPFWEVPINQPGET